MVPLRLDVCDDRSRSVGNSLRPQLVLKDMTKDLPSDSPVRTSVRPSPFRRLENVFLAAAVAAVLLFFFFSFALSLFHSVQQSYAAPTLPSVVMIGHTVKHGDTLTGLASRYGDPNTYILAREEQISRVNHLLGTAPLVPGQRLRIPVTNPTLIAQIEHRFHHGLVASR